MSELDFEAATRGPEFDRWLDRDALNAQVRALVDAAVSKAREEQDAWWRDANAAYDKAQQAEVAPLIAAARTALPELLAELEQVEAQLVEAKEAIRGLRAENVVATTGWGEQLHRAEALEARHRALVEAGDGAVKWLERNGAFTCSTGINGDFCSCGGCGLTSAFKAFRALLSGEAE